jgi:actin-related protein
LQALLALVRSASTYTILGAAGSRLQVAEKENVIKKQEAQEKRRLAALAREEVKAKKEAAAKERARKKEEKEKEKVQRESNRKAERDKRESENKEIERKEKEATSRKRKDVGADEQDKTNVKPKRQKKVLGPTSIVTRNQKRKGAEMASMQVPAKKAFSTTAAAAKVKASTKVSATSNPDNAPTTTGPKGTVLSLSASFLVACADPTPICYLGDSIWEVGLLHEDISANLYETCLEKTAGDRLWAMRVSTALHGQPGLIEEAKDQLEASAGMWSMQTDDQSGPDERHPCLYLYIADNHRWTLGEPKVYVGYH